MLSFKLSSYYHGNCVLGLCFHPLQNGQGDVCLFKLIKFFISLFLSVFSQGYFGRPNNAASHRVDSLWPDPAGLEGFRNVSAGRASCEVSLPTCIFLPVSLIIPPLEHGAAVPGPCRMLSWGLGSFLKETAATSAWGRGGGERQVASGSISTSSVLGFGGPYLAGPRNSWAHGHKLDVAFGERCFQIYTPNSAGLECAVFPGEDVIITKCWALGTHEKRLISSSLK